MLEHGGLDRSPREGSDLLQTFPSPWLPQPLRAPCQAPEGGDESKDSLLWEARKAEKIANIPK